MDYHWILPYIGFYLHLWPFTPCTNRCQEPSCDSLDVPILYVYTVDCVVARCRACSADDPSWGFPLYGHCLNRETCICAHYFYNPVRTFTSHTVYMFTWTGALVFTFLCFVRIVRSPVKSSFLLQVHHITSHKSFVWSFVG